VIIVSHREIFMRKTRFGEQMRQSMKRTMSALFKGEEELQIAMCDVRVGLTYQKLVHQLIFCQSIIDVFRLF
jgi:hypothetical protein